MTTIYKITVIKQKNKLCTIQFSIDFNEVKFGYGRIKLQFFYHTLLNPPPATSTVLGLIQNKFNHLVITILTSIIGSTDTQPYIKQFIKTIVLQPIIKKNQQAFKTRY